MSRIENLADKYGRHIVLPWQRTVSGAQRVVMLVYEKELERSLRAQMAVFETATRKAGHDWREVDVTGAFARWMAGDEYRDSYFDAPEDLRLKVEAEFGSFVAAQIREALTCNDVTGDTVVALCGAGSLFGFCHVSQVLKLVERDIRGRLVVFFPGQFENNNYRLLDARDGWNYLAVPVTQYSQVE